MKTFAKIFISALLTLSLMLCAVACKNDSGKDSDSDNIKNTPEQINIATLNGTTGFGMAKLISDSNNSTGDTKYNISVMSDASLVTSSLINGTLDIAALPTNAAANLYAKTNGKIKILAVNTLGVLYVVASDNVKISSLSDLNGKTVYCPAQNPYFIVKGLLDKAGINANIDSTTYAEAATLREAAVAGRVDIAILPEPMVTIALSKSEKLSVALDITAEWNKNFPENSLMQGCIVARTEFIDKYPEALEDFLSKYKTSVEYVNSDPEGASELIAQAGIFEKAAVAKKAIPKCNIKYIDGKEMADALDVYFAVLYSIAPASVGGSVPDSGIYYNK